jgi:tRNA (guanine-N7-)-methyltransferase
MGLCSINTLFVKYESFKIKAQTEPFRCAHYNIGMILSATPASKDDADDTQSLRHRHIQSFVHRRSHFSKAQQAAYARLLPVWGIAYTPKMLDFKSVFGNENPVVLEIGCGMGETTAAIALACPNVNFLGIEVYNAGVATLLTRIETLGLTNLRLVQHDAVVVLRDMVRFGSLAGVHIYCPDPWPKARHLKRRLIQAPFIASLLPHLVQGAYIHCATDVQDYAAQMLAVLAGTQPLRNLSVDPANAGYHSPSNPFASRPTTKFEARGQRLGHGMWDVVFVKPGV